MKTRYISILLAFVLIIALGFAGCSSQSKFSSPTATESYAATAQLDYEETADEYYAETAAVEGAAKSVNTSPETGGGDSGNISQMNPEVPSISGRKLIVNATLVLETKEFDGSIQLIQAQVSAFGGYVEKSTYQNDNIYNPQQSRMIDYTLRIPAAKSAEFLASLDKGSFNILSSNQNVQDVTENFYDLEARRDSLIEQKTRLEGLMDTKADLEYLIHVEQEIARVTYEINMIHNQLRGLESLVDFSTVTITLREVVEYEEPVKPDFTFWQRIKNTVSYTWKGAVDGLQNFVLFIISSIPTLITLAVLAVIGFFIYRKVKRNLALKHGQVPPANYPNNPQNPNQGSVPSGPQEVNIPLTTDDNDSQIK